MCSVSSRHSTTRCGTQPIASRTMKRLFAVTVSLLSTSLVAPQQHQKRRSQQQTDTSCRVCGELGPSKVPFPNKRIPEQFNLPTVGSCFSLETTALALNEGSQICDSIQSFGSYCGCNIAPDACTLCWDGTSAPKRTATTMNYNASNFVSIVGPNSDVVLNCEVLEAFLHSTTKNDSVQCFSTQLDVGEQCGCPPIPENRTQANNGTEVDRPEPIRSGAPCTLCINGEAPPFPNKVAHRQSCSEWEAFGAFLLEDSEDCSLLRLVSGICECSRQPDACSLCPLGETVPRPNQGLNWLDQSTLTTTNSELHARLDSDRLTCELMESAVATKNQLLSQVMSVEDGLVCPAVQMKSWICGCRPDWRAILLTWAYRSSGMLSFIVSRKISLRVL